jgi:4-aminobutyrate aminotransferase-like enzyme
MLLDMRPPEGFTARAIGALAAIEQRSTRVASLGMSLLSRGIIAIPGGISSATISLYPAFTINARQLSYALDVMSQISN